MFRYTDAGTETTGSVNFRCDMQTDPAKRHVLVVDDIIDTGGTLAWCAEHMGGNRFAGDSSPERHRHL